MSPTHMIPTHDTSWTSTWRPLTWITLWSLGLAWLFLTMPTLDLYLSGLFFNPEIGKFALSRHPVARFLNDVIEGIAVSLCLFVVIGLAVTKLTKNSFLQISHRQFIFIFCTVALAPGLLVNGVFKNFWGRARPRYLTEFGGSLDFSPAWVISDQCANNCSFVSGDAAMAFSLFALALCLPSRRRIWPALAVFLGSVISLSRFVQGAHFASDVIFAGLITLATIFGLKALLLDDQRLPLTRAKTRGRLEALGIL